jgi:hypothetical protein
MPMLRRNLSNSTKTCFVISLYEILFLFFPVARKPNSGLGRLTVEFSTSTTTRNLWPIEQIVTENTTTQYTTNITDGHALNEIRNRYPSNEAASDLRLQTARPPESANYSDCLAKM